FSSTFILTHQAMALCSGRSAARQSARLRPVRRPAGAWAVSLSGVYRDGVAASRSLVAVDDHPAASIAGGRVGEGFRFAFPAPVEAAAGGAVSGLAFIAGVDVELGRGRHDHRVGAPRGDGEGMLAAAAGGNLAGLVQDFTRR